MSVFAILSQIVEVSVFGCKHNSCANLSVGEKIAVLLVSCLSSFDGPGNEISLLNWQFQCSFVITTSTIWLSVVLSFSKAKPSSLTQH